MVQDKLRDKWHGLQNGSQKATRMNGKGPGVVAQLVRSGWSACLPLQQSPGLHPQHHMKW